MDLYRWFRNNVIYKDKLGKVKIGKNCFYDESNFDSKRPDLISIGDNVILSTRSILLTHDPSKNKSEPVRVGSNTFIGYGAIVLMGNNIGHDCVVGAGSVVTKNVPNYTTVVGNPARAI